MTGKDGQATTVGARKLQDLLRALPDDAHAQRRRQQQQDDGARRALALQPADAAAADYPRISLGTEQLQTLSLPQKDLRSLFKLAEFAMAQQDIRYYLNGMLLVVDKGTLQAVATDGHRLSWASIAVRRRLRAPGSDPAAQDGARAGQAARPTATTRSRSTSSPTRCASASATSSWCRRSSTASFPTTTASFRSATPSMVELDRVELLAALQRAAILSNEKFRGVRVVLADGPAEDHLHEQRAGRGRGRARGRLQGRSARHRLQHHLPARRAVRTSTVDKVRFAFGDANSSALVTMPDRDDYKYVVMPMRI